MKSKLQRISAVICLLSLCWLPVGAQMVAGQSVPDYANPRLPIDKRVDDLVSRLTLEEKISQMMNKSAAIDRLGIPAYDWWNEALHGVAYAGTATVFPQAIGLGATWNEQLIHRVASAISDEARAKYNEAIANNQRKRFYGLTFWSPNINIFRDPRWGRGQETYGEDPFLTARLGVAFVKGMQGNDSRYLKTIATPKHYAVHSGPESERHVFNAKPAIRDLEETYLPAFRASVSEAKARSIMCAYNSVDGEPVCASKRMLDEILRAQWGFDGYVVSDCDAIADIYKHHRFAKTEEEGVAVGVKAGTDLTCGYEYRALLPAIKRGLISEAEIDTAVKRLFRARFRLGMFDPPETVPFSKIPFAVNDSATNRELARKAAQESIVLLRNENHILPLKKDLNTIAVIGPNADSLDVLLGNYHGIPSQWVTPLAGIKQKISSNTRVLSALGTSLTGEIVLPVPSDAIFSLDDPNVHGMKGEYFNNKDLQGEPVVTRTDEQVNFDWFTNSPVTQLNTDNFSVRWTGHIVPPVSGVYQFGMRSDDGVRLYLDDKLFIEDWRDRSARTVTAPVQLEAGRRYKIRIEYYERYAAATAKLVWKPPQIEKKLWDEAIDKAKQAEVVIMALGLSPSLEGEEMEVKVKGFSGGDRTDLNLPEAQESLLKAVVATGKPVVLVLLNGSALAINWATDNVPGIIEAWYPGEEGGAAVADVIFGDYNPGGRLPVTFYKSTDDLPPFRDYSMDGRTYRYYKGEPLYPFGFGLSYTNFTYSNLKLPKRVKATDKIEISIDVQNSGSRGGDEVAQLYVTDVAASAPVPIRTLKGLKRFYLAPGEKKHLTFALTPRDLTLIDNRGKRILEPGEFRISVGGKQPGAEAKSTQVLTSSFVVTGRTTEIP